MGVLRVRRRLLQGVAALLGMTPFVSRWSVAAPFIGEGKSSLGLPFETVIVAGKDAASRMSSLRSGTGCVPVVVGEPTRLVSLAELLAANGSFDDTLSKGLALNVDKWIDDQRASEPDYYRADGPLTDVAPVAALASVRDVVSGSYLPRVAIALCKVAHPWEVAAVLRPGGWNECPAPEVHLAFFKRWHERYGAVVSAVTDDVIEFTVAHPPQSADEAMSLAEEQFIYCPDIVHQGVNSLQNLAASLRGCNSWYFWWD